MFFNLSGPSFTQPNLSPNIKLLSQYNEKIYLYLRDLLSKVKENTDIRFLVLLINNKVTSKLSYRYCNVYIVVHLSQHIKLMQWTNNNQFILKKKRKFFYPVSIYFLLCFHITIFTNLICRKKRGPRSKQNPRNRLIYAFAMKIIDTTESWRNVSRCTWVHMSNVETC